MPKKQSKKGGYEVIACDDDFIMHLNESIKEGVAALHAAEKESGIPYTLEFRYNAKGRLQMHVEPENAIKQ